MRESHTPKPWKQKVFFNPKPAELSRQRRQRSVQVPVVAVRFGAATQGVTGVVAGL